MNILFLSHVRDATAANGGMVYSNQILSQLRLACNRVDVVYIYDQPPKFRKVRIFLAMLRSIFSRIPAKVLYFDRPHVHRALLRQAAAMSPDLVIFDHLETVAYLRDFLGSAIPVLIQHNDEAKLYEQRLGKIGSSVTSVLLRSESKKLRQFQESVSHEIKNKVFISSDELDSDRALSSMGNRISILPTFDYKVQSTLVRDAASDLIHVAFIGNMKWWPNQDAVDWLLKEVAPRLKDNVVIHLIGMESDAERYQRKNVIGHGFVDCTSDIWDKANIFLSPIVSGAGLNVKVAEALYNQKSIITTTRGIRGIPIKDDPAIVVTDDADMWVKVLNDNVVVSHLSSTLPLPENSSLFSRGTSVAKLKKFLEACQ